MKKILFTVLSLSFMIMVFTSCDDSYTDLMTADAKTGGMLYPQGSFPYKLGETTDFNISVNVPKGPAISAIEVYRSYTGKSEVLDQTVTVSGANANDDGTVTLSYNYAKLTQGLSMPADESTLNIGDAWTLRYVSVMEDGRKVDVGDITKISVANFFAGTYNWHIMYFHPTAGGVYPTTPYAEYSEDVDLVAVNATACKDYFGVWTDNTVIINIAADNTVTLTIDRDDVVVGDYYDPSKVCSYDPVTKVISIYYYYMGSGGPRQFWVVYTPKN